MIQLQFIPAHNASFGCAVDWLCISLFSVGTKICICNLKLVFNSLLRLIYTCIFCCDFYCDTLLLMHVNEYIDEVQTFEVIYEQRERVFHRDIQTRENNV